MCTHFLLIIISILFFFSYQISRWELGTQNFEALAGVTACIDYIATLGARGGDARGRGAAEESRRSRIVAGWEAVQAHEELLKKQFLSGAALIPNLRVFGFDDQRDASLREPTFAVARVLAGDSGSSAVRAHTTEQGEPGYGFAHPEWLTQQVYTGCYIESIMTESITYFVDMFIITLAL